MKFNRKTLFALAFAGNAVICKLSNAALITETWHTTVTNIGSDDIAAYSLLNVGDAFSFEVTYDDESDTSTWLMGNNTTQEWGNCDAAGLTTNCNNATPITEYASGIIGLLPFTYSDFIDWEAAELNGFTPYWGQNYSATVAHRDMVFGRENWIGGIGPNFQHTVDIQEEAYLSGNLFPTAFSASFTYNNGLYRNSEGYAVISATDSFGNEQILNLSFSVDTAPDITSGNSGNPTTNVPGPRVTVLLFFSILLLFSKNYRRKDI
tara:strand:- start:270 stop:1061 length:792 start_codon:yes stop_codon:yes gene_type:complete